ncbi:MAG: hypothetical protein ACOC90_09785 [Bacteroidota bacterium]
MAAWLSSGGIARPPEDSWRSSEDGGYISSEDSNRPSVDPGVIHFGPQPYLTGPLCYPHRVLDEAQKTPILFPGDIHRSIVNPEHLRSENQPVFNRPSGTFSGTLTLL